MRWSKQQTQARTSMLWPVWLGRLCSRARGRLLPHGWRHAILGYLGILLGIASVAGPVVSAQTPALIERVSVSSAGIEANDSSGWPHGRPAVSADGRWVAFESSASNLVSGDTNGCADVFVRDLQTGLTERVSIPSSGGEANGWSGDPAISADGRYVAYGSAATNLMAGDTNGVEDVFVVDRTDGSVARVSVAGGGTQADAACRYPSLSADGRYVAFESFAGTLVPGDTNSYWDVFVHDRDLDADGVYDEPGQVQTRRVSVASDGSQAEAMGTYTYGQTVLSADGRYVAFVSWSRKLTDLGENPNQQVLVHDRVTGATICASSSAQGTPANGSSTWPSLSADGRYLAFASLATNLISPDNQGGLFVRDLVTGQVDAATLRVDGQGGGTRSSISGDGRYIAFESTDGNLVAGDTNAVTDVFVLDRLDETMVRLSQTAGGVEGNGHSTCAVVSSDGQRVAFHSEADNLISGDTNGVADVFVAQTGGRVDLSVEQVAMVQTVAGVEDLVAGKPVGLVVTVRSTGAVSAPVAVRAEYGGAMYERFYVVEASNVDQNLCLLQDAAALTFAEAATKTLCFFPEEAPWGSYAMVTVTIDGGAAVGELDASNNSVLRLQPVVETSWTGSDAPLSVLYSYGIEAGHALAPDEVAQAWDFQQITQQVGVLPLAAADYAAEQDWLTWAPPQSANWYASLLDMRRAFALSEPGYGRHVVSLPEVWWGGETSCGTGGAIPPLAQSAWSAAMPVPLGRVESGEGTDAARAPAAVSAAGEETASRARTLAALGVTHNQAVPLGARIPVTGGLDVTGRRYLDNTFAESMGRSVVSFAGSVAPGDLVWVDSVTYATLLASARNVVEMSPSSEPVLVVSGSVSDGTASLGPCYVGAWGPPDPESAGDYTVNCLGADGAMLAQRAFDAPEGVPRSDASSGQPVSVPFAVVMPFPPETVDIVLKHDDVALARVSRTEHAPTVAITYPNGGEVLDGVRTVTWSAWDTDGDALVYSVLHSADEGATWDVLAMDLREPRFEWDTRCAPGGTQTCLLQVVASDGINTTVNLSDGVFSVANKAPSAVIMAPCDGASVAQDLSVRLRGAAVDPEAGWLTGASLVWTSDRDGYLGTGQDLQVLLTPGAHVVTLTATDALGGVARHQVNVTVVDVPMLDVSLGGSGVLRGLSPTAYRPTWVGARVRVVGQGAAVHMHVYDGDPSAGGRLIGSRRLDLGANTDTAVGVPWTPSTAGDHSMWVVVSSEGATESSTANNEISGTVCVAAAEQAPIVVPLVLTSR